MNRCIDWTRKKKPQTVSAISDGGEEELDIYDTIADSGGGPEEALIKQENAVYLRKLVESLPEIYKTVIILYYFEDFSPQEISPGNIRNNGCSQTYHRDQAFQGKEPVEA